MPTLTFNPSGKTVTVPEGIPLDEACRLAGYTFSSPCGRKGICGKCRVQVLQGDVPVDSAQMRCLTATLLVGGWRASCVATVRTDLVLAEPTEAPEPIVMVEVRGREPEGSSDLWQCDLTLPEASLEDNGDDVSRFLEGLLKEGMADGTRKLRPDSIALPVVRELPYVLRENKYRCRVAGMGGRILGVWGNRDDEERRSLGLAVDLGTTTLAAALCDLLTGEVLAMVSAANPQCRYGDDVISRAEYAGRGPGQLAEMRRLVVSTIQDLAHDAMHKAKSGGKLLLVAVAGNTIMSHLLLGVTPAPLSVSPFAPAFHGPLSCWANQLGWEDDESVPYFLTVPNIASFVGGDVTAGILAHDILNQEKPTLYIDVGTNGEIVLAANGKAWTCATAAGPAFEGARISQGMRAAVGAISGVTWSNNGLFCEIIGGVPPRGICGTGLLDAVAALVAVGLVDETGMLLHPDAARDAGVGEKLVERIHERDDDAAVWLVRPGGEGEGVAITQRDIREVQLAKGAIAAGIRILLSRAGLEPQAVEKVCLAGGFGSYLRAQSALGIGLLPQAIHVSAIQTVGNASLAGARLYLHSGAERRTARDIRDRVRYVELSGCDEFNSIFAREMLFV